MNRTAPSSPTFREMIISWNGSLNPRPGQISWSSSRKEGIVTHAMIDISDGLSSELLHMCKSSNTGCRIYHDKIPIDASTAMMAEQFNMEPMICALHGGEDYELLFTVPLDNYEKVSKLPGISIIGNITDPSEGALLVTGDGQAVPVTAQGWDGMKK